MIRIAPSILSSDFSRLGEVVTMIDSAADFIHIDIMDGHFVPNITIGPMVVSSLRPYSSKPFDVHLMLTNPAEYVDAFVKAGTNYLTIHLESDVNLEKTLERIRELGCIPGLSIKPDTSVEEMFPYLDKVGMVLVMTVEPGFGGQSMIMDCLNKISILRKEIDARHLPVLTEIDGGVNLETIELAEQAGVDVAVAGSAVFGAEDPVKMINRLRHRN